MLEIGAEFFSDNWASVVAVGGFLATNIFGVIVFLLQRNADFKFRIREERLNRLRMQKNDFYDQILSRLAINEKIFLKFGPPSFARLDEQQRSDLAHQWDKVRSGILLPNNIAISDIIKNKAHLLNDSDSLDNYSDLIVHIAGYPLFLDSPSERYSNFMRFPSTISVHIDAQRNIIIAALKKEGAL